MPEFTRSDARHLRRSASATCRIVRGVTLTPWPLTGRSAQLEQLGRQYLDGLSGGVVLSGPAGVGKTRLAEEAVALAARAGRPTARAVGHPSTQAIPLGAMAHLLPRELVHDLGVGDDERTALFHAARAELRRQAGEDRLVLLIDDVDLLDDTSLAVLVPLIVNRTVFLIGTVRIGGAATMPLATLRRDGHVVRMQVEPLSTDELGALLHRVLDRPVSSHALGELARLSGGNLQVLTELVRGALDRGVLVESEGAWQLTAPLPTTTALVELVAEHLTGVDAAGLGVLEVLAVCGHLGLEDLINAHGSATLEALENGGLVTMAVAGRRTALRLAHPLYGEVLRSRLQPLRLRRIQQQLADLVETHGARRREDVVRIALWRVDSGGHISGEHLVRAARLALAGRNHALAIRLVRAIPDTDAVSIGERAEVLAEAHAAQGHHEAVESVVAGAWNEPLTDAQRASLVRRLAATRFYGRRDLAGALSAYEAARDRLTDPEQIAAVDVRRAALLAGAGRPLEAMRIADSVAPPAPALIRVELAAARAMSLMTLGRCDESIALSRQAAADHATLPGWLSRRGMAQHLANEARALAYSGRYAEARELLTPATDRSLATNAMAAWVWFEMALAEIARDTGRAREAIRRFQAVADAAPSAGQEAALVWAHVGVAQGHLLLGECSLAAAALQRADDAGESPVATSFTTRERTRAWLDACRGDLVKARERTREVAELSRRDGVYLFEGALLNDLVRLGSAADVVDRLTELKDVIDGPLVQAHWRHAVGMAQRDATLMADVVDRYEAMDVLGGAAEAAAELAELHRANGEPRRATAAQQRSAELAQRAGGIRTPAVARGRSVEPLTAREREVALLARAGVRSREIGDRLHLSTRTVDTHLARVYRKLGITGREELSAALGLGDDT